MSRRRSIVFVIIDIACAIALALGVILLSQLGKPYKRGFFCNDESIQKPYKDDTVSFALVTSVGFALVLVVVVITEILVNHQNKSDGTRDEAQARPTWLYSLKISPVIIAIVWVIYANLFGAAMNMLTTDIGKYSIGRLRPHFLDVCQPDWSKFNCTDDRGNNVFIVADVCTIAEGTKKAKNSRRSFPSGHSSFSAYMMVFLVLYVEAKLHLPKESKFLKPMIQALFIFLALYTGFSRISDYKHHSSDVLAGFALGTVIAFVTIFRILKPRFGRLFPNNQIDVIGGSETEHVLKTNPKYTEELP